MDLKKVKTLPIKIQSLVNTHKYHIHWAKPRIFYTKINFNHHIHDKNSSRISKIGHIFSQNSNLIMHQHGEN